MTTTSATSDSDLASDPRASALKIQDSVCCEQHMLVLHGELDLSNAAVLEGIIRRLCGETAKSLLIDLDLAFMDSSGLRAVLAGRDLCEQSGCELTIRVSSPAVRRLFKIAGVLGQLPIEPVERPKP